MKIKNRFTGKNIVEGEAKNLKILLEQNKDADLQGADLRNADLRNADLRSAHLQDADLQDADLRNADLRNANLRNADLWSAYLQGAKVNTQQKSIIVDYLGLKTIGVSGTDEFCSECGGSGEVADKNELETRGRVLMHSCPKCKKGEKA